MGQVSSKIYTIISNLFDYPLQSQPICFLRPEDYSCTGEPLPKEESKVEIQSEYDLLVANFNAALDHELAMSKELREQNRYAHLATFLELFPKWNEVVITNLQNNFLIFDEHENNMLNFVNVNAILTSIGDRNSTERRKAMFKQADGNHDKLISYEEYLHLIYYIDPADDEGNLTGTAALCVEAAKMTTFAESLTVKEQLEIGIF